MLLQNGVISLDCAVKSHIYLIPNNGGYTLIDAGYPEQGSQIVDELKHLLGDLKKIDTILITHSDFDHIGSLKYIYEHLNAKAYVSKVEYEH
jgi:glyoxylase-like metal-dependent hydrolase (beta-lactamase superfamily II)